MKADNNLVGVLMMIKNEEKRIDRAVFGRDHAEGRSLGIHYYISFCIL